MERLARLKNINFNKNLHEVEDTAEFGSKASIVKVRSSKEGKEALDIIKNLVEMNLSHVIGKILSYSSGEDLCKIAQVINKVFYNQRLNFAFRSPMCGNRL